jgi:phage anti-repressor protein
MYYNRYVGGLESKRQFGNWIDKKVINNPFFTEGIDWTVFTTIAESRVQGLNKSVKQDLSHRGANKKDYILTLSCAKKVAMSEQTEIGNKVRDYFLEVEKQWVELKKEIKVLKNNAVSVLIERLDGGERKIIKRFIADTIKASGQGAIFKH